MQILQAWRNAGVTRLLPSSSWERWQAQQSFADTYLADTLFQHLVLADEYFNGLEDLHNWLGILLDYIHDPMTSCNMQASESVL